VTIKINDESLNNLLPPKADAQFIARNSFHNIFSAGVMSRRSSSPAPTTGAVLHVAIFLL
jgi:hypothetical protein